MWIGTVEFVAAAALVTVVAAAPPTQKHEWKANHGAVASELKECSEAGGSMIKAGGNAVDAAIATALCVGTIGMHHSGIGGGGFALIRTPTGNYTFLDFRETAPGAAFEEMFVNKTDKPSLYSGQASGVPGELRGLETMHKRFGQLPWRALFKPSIHYAKNGFLVNPDLAKTFAGLEFLHNDPAWARDFAPKGTLVKEGETMYRKRYAETLEKIARHGAKVFYSGEMADSTVRTLKARDGIMTLEDLQKYEVAEREPLSITYRGYKIWGTSAPSSGAVALSALKIYEGFEVTGNKVLDTHRLIEATKFAYGQRTKFGDPSFVQGLWQFQRDTLSEPVIKELRSKILDDRILGNSSFYEPDGLESIDTPGTAHIATTDSTGFSVSMTTTINTWFGSRIMDPFTGIIFNSQMDDFSVPGSSNYFGYLPSPSNFILPGKRPLSSITPLILESPSSPHSLSPLSPSTSAPYLIIGSAGGSRITTATLQTVHHIVDNSMTLLQALSQGRWHNQLNPEVTSFEWRYGNDTVGGLKKRGHRVEWTGEGGSSVQGVRVLGEGKWEAVGEVRQRASGGMIV
ncbi:gamma-glutamyltranspeptidase [Ascodesmis nigricans]|uniref:Glutathione hydrolase n=1 Tax=Ascodesmis nigricans TaxID=341454 RepID=A0A4S2MNZ1_9PEZI|nr:gamma-glutamyltranspeptidase [Ascodesmis nigricans]